MTTAVDQEESKNRGLGQSMDASLDAKERAAIDVSCRWPVLMFFGSALFWLLAGSLFGFLASMKLHRPEFFTGFFGIDFGFLNFGRLRPAHLNVVAYGWASLSGIGVSIWLFGRLCRVPLRNTTLVMAACVLWNFALVCGVAALLTGHSTSIEWLEFPRFVTFLLFCSYALVGIWAVDMFVRRKPGHIYISLWYLLAAFFWFPWLFGTANLLFQVYPVQGSVQGIINWWYAHNVLGLWFTPIGLAAAYYMIPKVLGRPVYSYYLSALGFWSLALFYSWNGGHHLIGGPLPAWLVTASIVASVMMVIPVLVTAINHHMSVVGNFSMIKYSPTLRFTVFGAMAYTAASFQGSSMAIRSLNEVTHFTHYTIGHAHLGLYAFYTMIIFGAMYYIIPRLIQSEWASASLIKLHFWTCAYGIVLMVFTLTIGGLIQGMLMNDPQNGFDAVLKSTLPWLRGRSLSGILLTVGHLAFAIHFVMMLIKLGRKEGGPTLLGKPGEVRA